MPVARATAIAGREGGARFHILHNWLHYEKPLTEILDTHVSCELYRDKLRGRRCPVLYLYHSDFSYNVYLLVF